MKKENRKVVRLDIILALILLILAAVILWEQGVFDPLLNKLPSFKKKAAVTETAEASEEEFSEEEIFEEPYPDEGSSEETEDFTEEEPDITDEETSAETSAETDSSSELSNGSEESDAADAAEETESENGSSESSSEEADSEEDASVPYYEPVGGSYDQILVNVLSALLSDDYGTLAEYVSEEGLRLCPMGAALSTDVILSKDGVTAFPERDSTLFGYRRGSGNAIYMTGSEYCHTFICPDDFDFSAASVYYDAGDDLSLAESFLSGTVHTVRYTYEPNIMDWQDIVLVFVTEDDHDSLAAIMHRDATTH